MWNFVDDFLADAHRSADWSSEAAKMCAVYENAYVTITATAAKDCEDGFLRAQAKNRCRTYPMPHEACQKIGIPKGNITAIQGHDAEYGHEALHDRAWCFQEWMLSKRILSFRQEEIQYLCLEDQRCDCYFAHEGTQSTGMKQLFERALEAGNQRKLHDKWLSIVQDYKARSITQGSDRLPALAGLAIKFHQYWPKAKYLAGVWSNDVLDSLVWATNTTRVQDASPNRCFPSWSWASIESQAWFKRRRDNEYVTQVSNDAMALTAYIRHDFYPDVVPTEQYIQLYGQLKTVLFRYDPEKCEGRVNFLDAPLGAGKQPDREQFWQVELDCALEPSVHPKSGSDLSDRTNTIPSISRATWRKNHTGPFECPAFCLRLSTDQVRLNVPMPLCLLLTMVGEMDLPLANFIFPIKGEVPGPLSSILKPKKVPVFRRIGYVNTDASKFDNVEKTCVFIV